MYLRRIIIFVSVSSVVSLIWSMVSYYHYIQTQLFTTHHPDIEHIAGPPITIDSEHNSNGNDNNDNDNNKSGNTSNSIDFTKSFKSNGFSFGYGDALLHNLDHTPAPTELNTTHTIPPLRVSNDERTQPLSYYFDKSVMFMGMINNAEETLPHVLQQLNELTCLFRDTFFFFFESNSDDNTAAILQQWHDNKTLHADATAFHAFCDRVIDSRVFAEHRARSISKHMLYGDSLVRTQLAREVKKRSNSSYIHKLSRVEKFVPYRNMMLRQLYQLSVDAKRNQRIAFDYLFMIDVDVFEIDFVSFLNELLVCPTHVMCANGVDAFEHYRDSFATVEMSHNWIFRPFIFNKTDAYYDKARNILRKKMPRKGQRFEEVRSCFNGLAAYKLDIEDVIERGKCKYFTNDDVLLLKSQLQSDINDDDDDDMREELEDEWNLQGIIDANDNSNDDADENVITNAMKGDNQWIHDVVKLINWNNLKGVMYDIDSGYETNLCEHIAFHYCLSHQHSVTLSIATNTKLFYYPLKPEPTRADRRAMRRRQRRAARRQQYRQNVIMSAQKAGHAAALSNLKP